jgi:hypothetical protein
MDDAELGRRLAGALHDEAGRTHPPAGAWDRFRAGLDGAAPAAQPTGSSAAAAGRHPHRWRIPLIAAAAVAVIAVATAAIVPGGFGTLGHPVAAGPAGPAAPGAASRVTVTIDTAADRTGTASPKAAATVTMSFVGGRPPTAALHGIVTGPDGSTIDAGQHTSDGTPLGYLTLSDDGADSHYLWGAVDPAVLQVQIGVVQPAQPGDVDPGFSAGPHWTIDSGEGTPWSLPEAATTVWADLGDGWHGFAVRIPGDATQISAIALGTGASMLQNRLWDPATGRASDGPLAGSTGSPPTTAGTGAGFSSSVAAPPTSASPAAGSGPSTAMPPAPSASTTGYGCPFGAGSGSGFGISDTGFHLGTVEFITNEDDSVVCFFDGVSWWNRPAAADLPTESGNGKVKPLLGTGITGVDTFGSMMTNVAPTTGRMVWGTIGPGIVSVGVTVDGSPRNAAQTHQVTPGGVRVFLARVPAKGTVTVSARNDAGTVVATERLG